MGRRYTIPVPSGAAATALAFALRQIGKPYQWGATSPDAYAAAGIHFAPSPSAGAKTGPTVPLTEIQPGDLLARQARTSRSTPST